MEKFAVDLDKVLDELEEYEDDSERAHPPSLVQIATCNALAFGSNCGLAYSWCNYAQDQPVGDAFERYQNLDIGHRAASSSYSYLQTIEKIDISEADFGVSVKEPRQSPVENQLLNCEQVNLSHIIATSADDTINKNHLDGSQTETILANTEVNNKSDHVFETDVKMVEEEETVVSEEKDSESDLISSPVLSSDHESDEILCVEINQECDDKNLSSTCDEVKIKLNSSQDTPDLSKSSQNVESDSTLVGCSSENLNKELKSDVFVTDTKSIHLLEVVEAEEIIKKIDSANEGVTVDECSDVCEESPLQEKIASIEGQDLPSSSSQYDSEIEVVKFGDVNFNIENLTEEEIEKYLNELNEENGEAPSDSEKVSEFQEKLDSEASGFSDSVDGIESRTIHSVENDKELNQNQSNDVPIHELTNNNQIAMSNQQDGSQETCNNNFEANSNCPSEDLENSTEIMQPKVARPTTLKIPTLFTSSINNQVQINSEDNQFDDNANVSEEVQEEDNSPLAMSSQTNGPIDNQLNNHYEMASGLTEEEQLLGRVKPFWIPDQDTQMCMHCDLKFTVIKRRHHCRACGKVLCSNCCNQKAKLIYLENREARVCHVCYSTLLRVSEVETSISSIHSSPGLSNDNGSSEATENFQTQASRFPDPNNPAEYCSTISPLEQAQADVNRPPPTVMVPVGVLKRSDRPRVGEPKQVKFSDGIRPGGDLTETVDQQMPFHRRLGRLQYKLKSPPFENAAPQGTRRSKHNRIVISDVNGPLPPIINSVELFNNSTSKPTMTHLLEWLKDKDGSPVVFLLTKNLHIITKIVSKNCCLRTDCWSFTTKGMSTIGQDELLVLIECLPDEDTFPRDIFRLFTTVYDSAFKGNTFTELSHVFFPDGLFGNKDNGGFLFIRPTMQCFSKLVLPAPPFLIAILIHKWEIPWAKVFPLRLILRLGAEYRYYPCPIISFRFRKSAYCEIGHTIMNVLADFRNYQYTLPFVPGLVIHLQDKQTKIFLPRNRYDKILKVLNNSNEHVLPFGANFSLKADSHLVCIQNDDGQYQTQAINIENAPRSITGASFVVFSGALKSTTGLTAKISIVEDGLLVQIPSTTMTELRNSLKEMKNFVINCGKINAPVSDESLTLTWTDDDHNINLGVRSPIDGSSLEGVQSVRIYNGTDYATDRYLIRWTEIFFLHLNENSRRVDTPDPTRLAETVAQALCLVLTSHLDVLYDNGLTKIGLRVNMDPDKVGYEVGSRGMPLPESCTSEFDGALIPVIMDNIASGVEDLLVMELLFHILVK